jgi:hypothetical protein
MKNASLLRTECLVAMFLAGRGPVRKTLESLVNRGIVAPVEAKRVWRDVFGERLIVASASNVEVELRA